MTAAPKLVLIGDSIRIGYEPFVRKALAGIAAVWGPQPNCSSTRQILSNAESWLVRPLSEGGIVHINAGLHDLRCLPQTGGEPLVPIEEYERNLDQIVATVIAVVGADRVCLATSTPVDDARHAIGRVSNRHEADVRAYNERVVTVADRRGALLDDLHAVIAAEPAMLLSGDGVHLSEPGNRAVARAVARTARGMLA
jgi:lysophospholipase L1-like esterase